MMPLVIHAAQFPESHAQTDNYSIFATHGSVTQAEGIEINKDQGKEQASFWNSDPDGEQHQSALQLPYQHA